MDAGGIKDRGKGSLTNNAVETVADESVRTHAAGRSFANGTVLGGLYGRRNGRCTRAVTAGG